MAARLHSLTALTGTARNSGAMPSQAASIGRLTAFLPAYGSETPALGLARLFPFRVTNETQRTISVRLEAMQAIPSAIISPQPESPKRAGHGVKRPRLCTTSRRVEPSSVYAG